MPFREGEIYRCPLQDCGCEVTVTKAAPADCQGEHAATCCCGQIMVNSGG